MKTSDAALLLALASWTTPTHASADADLDADLVWRDAPNAWHQSLARIVDHRFSTFPALLAFARDAKKAGVSALMLVDIQKTEQCPGPWYNGLQLCDHINGSYPAAGGSLAEWQAMVAEIRPMRLMWWTNPTYWSVQGPVWAQAVADKASDVGRWFSWGDERCTGIPPCSGANVVVPGVGCAQVLATSRTHARARSFLLSSAPSHTWRRPCAGELGLRERLSRRQVGARVVWEPNVRRPHGRRDGQQLDAISAASHLIACMSVT